MLLNPVNSYAVAETIFHNCEIIFPQLRKETPFLASLFCLFEKLIQSAGLITSGYIIAWIEIFGEDELFILGIS